MEEPEPDGWSEVCGDHGDEETIFSIQTVQQTTVGQLHRRS